MAIVLCSECGGNVATTAKACPHCGHPSKPDTVPIVKPSSGEKPKGKLGIWIIAAIILIPTAFILVGFYSWQSVIKAGNETAAAQSIDNIRKFELQYVSRNKVNFGTFNELIAKVSLDDKFSGEKPVVNGYIFKLRVEPASGSRPSFYSITADPEVGEGVTATGTRHYYTDSTLDSIKFTDENRPSKVDDPSL